MTSPTAHPNHQFADRRIGAGKIWIRWRLRRGGAGEAGTLVVTHRGDGRCRVRYFAGVRAEPGGEARGERAAEALRSLGVEARADGGRIVVEVDVAEGLIDRLRAGHLDGGIA